LVEHCPVGYGDAPQQKPKVIGDSEMLQTRNSDIESTSAQVRRHPPFRDHGATMRAWERFVTGDSVPPQTVEARIAASWQRSAECGIKPEAREAPVVVGDAFEDLRWRHRELRKAASALFLETKDLLIASRSIMILTSAAGVVLDAVGNTQTLDKGQYIHLMPGGDWREVAIGTNGIGTALATRGPAQVHAAEHFCEGIKRWTCAAAPVCEPGTGTVLGVLDISGSPQTHHGNNLTLAVAAARQIETMLAGVWTLERMRLLEASLTRLSRSDAAGLVAIDRRGRLVHVTGRVPLTVGVGERVPGFEAGSPIEAWAGRLPPALRPEWLNPVIVDGETIGAMLIVPAVGLARARPVSSPIADQSSEADPKRSAFAHIEGRSRALQTIIERGRQLAGKRVTVLIEGETGVGKELFARALHGEERRNTPFITFNCAATSKELVGDELFGHVRGAFTGAAPEGRAGRFELADGGTLCLDEIGDMPLALQPVLLRALEEGVIYRLGDSRPRHVNVRLLALTNRNLLEEVEAGRFRRDLYHRISVTRLRIPPLRERDADIELLAERFNRKLAQRHGVPEKHFGAEVMALLKTYRWPGNVRELRNVIESLVLTCADAEVAIEELPAEILDASPAAAPTNAATSPITHEAASLDDFEHLAIKRALETSHGNLTQAARALGISRSTLYRKVQRYHLEAIVKAFG
jgi:sigma-54 dependent transcriptional regulator, acetoin dehydrogenase operon transcriptional activator AcoR